MRLDGGLWQELRTNETSRWTTAGRHERAVAAAKERAEMAVERARLANAKARVAVRAATEVQSKAQLEIAKLTSMPRPPATPPPQHLFRAQEEPPAPPPAREAPEHMQPSYPHRGQAAQVVAPPPAGFAEQPGREQHIRNTLRPPPLPAQKAPDRLVQDVVTALGELAGGEPACPVAQMHDVAAAASATTSAATDPRMEQACIELVFNEASGWIEPDTPSSSTRPRKRA